MARVHSQNRADNPDWPWAADARALQKEKPELFEALMVHLSFQMCGSMLEPWLEALYTWLNQRFREEQSDLPPERQGKPIPNTTFRGDDLLEGLCVVSSSDAGSMDEEQMEYFLSEVRPYWVTTHRAEERLKEL